MGDVSDLDHDGIAIANRIAHEATLDQKGIQKHMLTKRIALLAAGALIFSACQMQSDDTDVASTQGTLSSITHVPMGQAKIHEVRGRLFATNMRTIADGVRSMFQPVVAWGAELDWANNTTAIRLNAINSRLSGEDITSSLALDRVGDDTWEIGAEFVSPSYRMNVYDGDQLVGTLWPNEKQPVHVHGRVIVVRVGFIVIIIIVRNTEMGDPIMEQRCAWELAFPEGVELVQGDTVLRGNRVEIIEDAHEPYGGVDEIQVLGNGKLTYLSEKVVNE